jgi:hypothetical protein
LETVATIDEGLPQKATQMKLDVLSAMHFIAEPWRLTTPRGFSIDHVSSNDDSAVKLTEVEENDWHSLQPHGMQFVDYPTCDSALEICGVWSVDQLLDQQLTRPEEESEEKEEVAERKATTFLDALKGQGATRQYMCPFDIKNSITVMCRGVENELYRLTAYLPVYLGECWESTLK